MYLAEDLRRDRRQVALKVLTPEAYGTVQGKMLRREFEILSKLEHPHLVRVYDYGRMSDGGVYLAEEYIDGFSLQDARALLEPAALIDVAMQILNGLSYLHGMGMIHRDIKPANVMLLWLDDAGVSPMVKLVDFGLSSADPKRDTLRGGTRSYMAPEIIRGEKGEPQSDMFSLGVTLYYALCGVLPFGPRTKSDPPPTEEAFRPPDPHRLNPEVPLALSRFTMALLRQVPDLNFMDAGEAMGALARDIQDASDDLSVGGFANSLDTSAPQVLRGYFERGILTQQEVDCEYLVRALTDGGEGRRGLVYLITGEPQTGKSRLLHEVQTSCKLSGRETVFLDASEAPAGPWGTIHELVTRALEQSPTSALIEAHRERLDLWRVLRVGVQTSMPEDHRIWLRGVIEDLVAIWKGQQPILFIENLEAADDESITFLTNWFERHGAGGALDLVAASSQDARLEPLLSLSSTRAVVAEGLLYEDVETFFHERLALPEIAPAWMEQLTTYAQGRPSYLEEVCRALLDAGIIRRESASRWSIDGGAFLLYSLPSGLRESFRRRLNVVGAASRELLELLTIANRPVEWAVLREMAMEEGGEGARDVDRAIETLRWRHFVRMDLEMSGRFISLLDPAIAQVVELLMSPEWRRSLHRRVGAGLALAWNEQGEDSGEIAHHFEEGDRSKKSRKFAWIKGQSCANQASWSGGREWFERAREGAEAGPNEALLELEIARCALGTLEMDVCMRAVEACARHAEGSSNEWITVHCMERASWIAWASGDIEYATRLLDQGTEHAPSLSDMARVLELRARIAIAQGAFDEGVELLEQSRARCEHFGDLDGALSGASQLAQIYSWRGDGASASPIIQRAYDLGRAPSRRDHLGEALIAHARLMRLGNEPDRALELLRDALGSMSSKLAGVLWIDLCVELALCYERLGQRARAMERLHEAIFVSEKLSCDTGWGDRHDPHVGYAPA